MTKCNQFLYGSCVQLGTGLHERLRINRFRLIVIDAWIEGRSNADFCVMAIFAVEKIVQVDGFVKCVIHS